MGSLPEAVWIGICIGFDLVVLFLWLARRSRERQPDRPTRAFEPFRILSGDVLGTARVKIGAALAIAVPIASLVLGTLATQAVGYHETIWRAVGMIGVAAVVCGSVLVMSSIPKGSAAIEKPHVEEDAYDVVSSRG